MPRYIAILFALPLFFTSCEIYDKNKPTEFFKIEEYLYNKRNEYNQYDSMLTKCEFFVLSNFPNDTSLLRKIVEEYNSQTIPLDTIKKYKSIEREFYQETQCLTRNYEKSKPYPKLHWWIGLWDNPCEFYYNGYYFGQQIEYHEYGEGYLIKTNSSCSLDSFYCKHSYTFKRVFR